jgi:glycosyltransferase involved in cell wall biosynthesis
VEVSALDDRRRRARRPALARLLGRLPSVLVHPYDRAHGGASLWTDLVLLRRLRALEPCVLVSTRPALNLLAARLAPPGVVTVGQEHLHARAHRPPLAAAIARDYPRLDVLTVLTSPDERDYGAILAGAATRVVRIPNPVPRLGGGRVDHDARELVALGRLRRQKGFDLLIEAFAPVAERHPDWTLRIHGHGRLRDRLEALVAQHGVEGRAVLMGATRRPGRALARGSIYVLSSRFEGFPMVLLEAMGKRLAVVSFDCPNGPADAIEDDVNGVLVPPGDTRALSAAMTALIEDPERRRRLGGAAGQTARRYALAAIGARWDALLEELEARAAGAVSR